MLQRPNKMPKNRQNQHNISIKTVKIVSQYNITDYLPPAQDYAQSRTIANIHRFRQKNATEPFEKSRQIESDELYKKISLLEQQKLALKTYLERANKDLMSCQEKLYQKENQLAHIRQISQQNFNKLKQMQKVDIPQISLERNILSFQIFPKFKQAYEVSVQTDPTFEQHSLSKETRNIPAPISSDMQHIYQKMESLKMGRRTSRPEINHLQPNFTSNLKPDRPRALTSNWGSFDKENFMRNSNLPEKKQTQKLQKVRDQTLDIFSMSLEQGQKLLAAYVDDSYL